MLLKLMRNIAKNVIVELNGNKIFINDYKIIYKLFLAYMWKPHLIQE